MKNTERVYLNRAAEQVLAIEAESPGDFSKISHLVKGDLYRKVFQETGDVHQGVWSAGTVMGLIDSVVSCQELCDGIMEEAEMIIRNRLNNALVEEE